MEVLALTPAIAAAREQWRYRGQVRPAFAEDPAPGQVSVWDFPRPPRLEAAPAALAVYAGDTLIARTTRGRRVLETAGAPTYYFPPEYVERGGLRDLERPSLCEWKGLARNFAWGDLAPAAWCYERTFEEFTAIAGWFAFYPARLSCFVGDEAVAPQPGGYYGGWVTADLAGPIKGAPGSGDW